MVADQPSGSTRAHAQVLPETDFLLGMTGRPLEFSVADVRCLRSCLREALTDSLVDERFHVEIFRRIYLALPKDSRQAGYDRDCGLHDASRDLRNHVTTVWMLRWASPVYRASLRLAAAQPWTPQDILGRLATTPDQWTDLTTRLFRLSCPPRQALPQRIVRHVPAGEWRHTQWHR